MSQELPIVTPTQESSHGFGRRIAAITIAGASLIAACNNEDSNTNVPLGGTETTVQGAEATNPTETTISPADSEAVKNIFNPTTEELQAFDCSDEENTKYGVQFVNVDGQKLAVQVLPLQMGVDNTKRDFLHRDDSNSLDSPFTADLANESEIRADMAANWCNKPAFLAATLHKMTNTTFGDQIVGEISPTLKQFINKSADEISAMITNPHNEAVFPAESANEYNAANIAATQKREELAEYVAAVFKSLQYGGIKTNANLTSDYALSADYVLAADVTKPAKFSEAGYVGNAALFGYTEKGNDCTLIDFGFNVGTGNPLDEGGDKRPVDVIEQDICETPTETTVPGTETTVRRGTTTTTNPSVTTTTNYIPPKNDNGVTPGGGNHGTPGSAGNGPAGQPVDPNGIGNGDVSTVSTQPLTTEAPTTLPAGGVEGTAPATTNKPVVVDTSPSTTIQTGPKPTQP